jgi:prophage maintenance system killer protein
VAEVIALHDYILTRMGQPVAAVRDEGALAAAVMRPRMVAHYERADLSRQGVVLAAGITAAQAFVDGNKRAALAALDNCWRLNGLVVTPAPLAWARQIEALSVRSGSLAEATDAFEAWIRTQQRPGGPC